MSGSNHEAGMPPVNKEPEGVAMAVVVTTPECLSAAAICLSHSMGQSHVQEIVEELQSHIKAVANDNMSRPQAMLVAQAHTLESVFVKLLSKALTTKNLDVMERYMKLALKAQSQSRATIQTLSEVKMPRQFAFVQQANIGHQVQVTNTLGGAVHGEPEIRFVPNELLEINDEQGLERTATTAAGRIDKDVAAMGVQHRTQKSSGKSKVSKKC